MVFASFAPSGGCAGAAASASPRASGSPARCPPILYDNTTCYTILLQYDMI